MNEQDDAHLDALVKAEVDLLRVEYRKTIPAKILELESALTANNIIELRSLAHKARGSAGSYGFDDLSKVFAEIEDAAVALLSGKESERGKITANLEKIKKL